MNDDELSVNGDTGSEVSERDKVMNFLQSEIDGFDSDGATSEDESETEREEVEREEEGTLTEQEIEVEEVQRTPLERVDWSKTKVAEPREECKRRQITVCSSKRKDELIKILQDDDNQTSTYTHTHTYIYT